MPDRARRAIRYHEHGTAEVLVRVRAAGVNPVDWKMRRGSNPNLPATPVIDVSGTVERAGPGVTGFRSGQEVWGTGQGTYAEYAIAPASSLVPKPPELSF